MRIHILDENETKIWTYNVWCTCMWCTMLNHTLIYTYFKCFDNSILVAILIISSYTGYFDTANTIAYGWISYEKIVRNYRIATFYLFIFEKSKFEFPVKNSSYS